MSAKPKLAKFAKAKTLATGYSPSVAGIKAMEHARKAVDALSEDQGEALFQQAMREVYAGEPKRPGVAGHQRPA